MWQRHPGLLEHTTSPYRINGYCLSIFFLESWWGNKFWVLQSRPQFCKKKKIRLRKEWQIVQHYRSNQGDARRMRLTLKLLMEYIFIFHSTIFFILGCVWITFAMTLALLETRALPANKEGSLIITGPEMLWHQNCDLKQWVYGSHWLRHQILLLSLNPISMILSIFKDLWSIQAFVSHS